MVTLKEIAKKAGVSVSTVSYVLNNDSRISEETKKKVNDVAEQLNYSGTAGKKKSGSSAYKNIVMHVHSVHGPIISEIIYSALSTISNNSFRLFVQLSDTVAHESWVDGYIILNSNIPDSDIVELGHKKVPIVLLDRALTLPNVKNVVIDNFNAMNQITSRTIERGCRTFCFVGGMEGYDNRTRFEGYSAALVSAGLSPEHMNYIKGDYTFEFGKNIARYLSRTELPDAIICANDEMALGVIHALRKIECPKPLMVTGFDGVYKAIGNIPYAYANYSFISARVNRQHMGSFAAFCLMEMVENKVSRDMQSIVIPCTIVQE